MSTQIIGFLDRKQLIDEAANWIAKLDAGHLSAADLSSLRAWAGTSKQHRDTLDQVASQWDELAILALNRTLASDQKQDIADDHSRWRGFANAAAVAGVIGSTGLAAVVDSAVRGREGAAPAGSPRTAASCTSAMSSVAKWKRTRFFAARSTPSAPIGSSHSTKANSANSASER